MKKFLLTAGVLAMATLSLFTSCKDDDTPIVPTITTVNVDKVALNDAEKAAQDIAIKSAEEDAKQIAPEGATVVIDNNTIITTNPDGTTTEVTVTTTYTYEINGKTYNTIDEVARVIASQPAGTTVKVTAILTQTTTTVTKDVNGEETNRGVKQETNSETSTVNIPNAGETIKENITLPTNVNNDDTRNVPIVITVNYDASHSGGAGR